MAAKEVAPLFTDSELDAFILEVHKGAFKDGSIDVTRAAKYASEFSKAMIDGYGKGLAVIDYDSPDAEMLASLQKNIFQFSAAKNRAEIMSMSSALRDDQGKLRTFSEFKHEATAITGEYSGTWLRTEYDNAVNAATMAARWVDHEANPDSWLVYRTVGDARVREAHRQLDGIARPIADPFWNTYYPPNGWNCRCDVQASTVKGNRGDIPSGAIDAVPPMFRVNLAKEGFAFPPGHPYYQAMTKTAEKQETAVQVKVIRSWAKENLSGSFVKHPVLGEIGLTNQGIKEALNQPHQFLFEKNEAIYQIEQRIKQSQFIRTAVDVKGRPFSFHYLETTINNKPSYIVIKQNEQTGDKTFYSIVDKLK